MDDSNFNRLPAELRVKVYEYALTFDRVSFRPHESSRFQPERSLTNQLALTRVCKQIRAECQHLPLTLNKLVVGVAPWQERSPWQERFFSISDLYSLVDDVAQNIASVPPGLMPASNTFLTLDMDPKIKAMCYRPGINLQLLGDWVAIKLFFGRLLLRTIQTHGRILLDVAPGTEKHDVHLRCEAGDYDPSQPGLGSRFELRPEIGTPGSSPRRFIVAATFDCAPVRATIHRHRDHDRSLCSVAKHGEQLLAHVGSLEYHARAIIARNINVWTSSSTLRI